MSWIQSFFRTPARQAMGWALLGILGMAMAGGGIWFLTGDGGGSRTADAGDEPSPTARPTTTPSPTRTATLSPSATASPTVTETASPSPTATTRPATDTNTGGGGGTGAPAPEPTATPEPTPPPVVAGGDYCPNSSSNSPPNSVIGIFTIGGAPAPANTAVSLAFDGVVGPTRLTTAAGGYRVDYFAGPEGCANRVGAAISVVYNGAYYATGHTVGDSPGAPVNVTLAIP
ncbi:MAG: hypothetical protein IPI85_02420 [Dehalococcoidia bacterium]|uniref:hypothetical protein n=1 Tax=Candidatus Amarobacter glycogenicus TaxID=3140699 RepID=UPI002A0CF098|nr:hypothetical protein [Dehalococcoidia bacterium]MBK6562133.1 hypothetical protein [Dehalococcoidia bacterium]MBK7124674.1 hypothetical protein [Dehalococcoidia bacterium]MBK7327972.1 hypothetical protein [Dehalococcoidia bacterium]MBK8561201.1 hypothetical protein [Dehalococcoidia bacterium]